LQQAGQWRQAEALLRQALAQAPAEPLLLNRLGVLLFQTQRAGEAVELFTRLVRLVPNASEGHTNLAGALRALGRFDEAIRTAERALALKPDNAEAANNLGLTLLDAGRSSEAIAPLQRALALRPEMLATYPPLAQALCGEDRFAEAVGVARELVRRSPTSAYSEQILGVALLEAGDNAASVESFQASICLAPPTAERYWGLAKALRGVGALDEAAAAAREAVHLRPDNAQIRNTLGVILQKLGSHGEALATFQEAVRLDPLQAESHTSLASAWLLLGRLDAAEAECSEAVRLKPDYAEAHFNRAFLRLMHGDFSTGWDEYEWRLKVPGMARHRFAQPVWKGEPLAGRTILLYDEQGYGDTLHFARFATLVAERGGRVVLECHEALARVLRTCPGVEQVVPRGEPLPAFDVYAPLLSVPRLLGTRLETIPATVPYLSADAALRSDWSKRIAGPGFKIGLCWQGRLTHPFDHYRSLRLEQLAPLFDVPETRFFSVQFGPARDQLAGSAFADRVVDLADELHDFADTAAALRELDLLISCDSAPVHLAGALGLPVWTLVATISDWRWLLDRDDTPWYPTMRLFRQRRLGDWAEVIGRMASALAAGQRRQA